LTTVAASVCDAARRVTPAQVAMQIAAVINIRRGIVRAH
jgi:hypothetical protein